ncbi:MAG: glycoside hydrolase family 2, partial [Alistipes sp.]|nr:glycoside hydrolase family 2 [Alistipes sp.]
FRIDRRRDRLDVGFDPYAAVAVSFPAATGSRFRLELSGLTAGCGLREVVLSSEPVVDRYEEKTFAKMFQEPLPYWNEYQWPAAADTASTVRLGQVLDLSDRLAGDTLCWDAPAGEWEILRTGMVPTGVTNFPALEGDGLGLEVDKMSRTHLQAHFDAFVGEILRRIPARDRRTWKVVVADSYEVGGQNFTDDFLASFERRYGYSAVPFLPVFDGVVVESPDASDRFLWDMRRLVADRLSYDHVGELTRLCHRHGLTTWLENYGHWGFMGEFLQYGGQADEVAGEFWSEGDLGNVENRAASSCAHIYGKQKVSSESFTCGGAAYSRYPRLMKQRGDRFFAEGINNTLLHVCISQKPEYRRPGLNTWYGNEFNRNNTWYAQLDLFTDYLKRCNFLLQQGLDVADVCYFIGEDTPKMTGIVQPALPRGYQFDYVNAEVILRDMTVRDGRWTLPHGTSYRLLVLPELKTMRPELLDKLERLVSEGGVLLGPRPERSPSYEGYPQADERVRTTAARLWGDADGRRSQTGLGMVLCGMEMPEARAAVGCPPDCAVPDDCPVVYGHRRTGGIDLYFLANQSSEKIAFPATFRVAGRQPELWEPASGRIRPLASFEAGEETTSVPLELEPLESVFVVFARPASEPAGTAATNYPAPRIVTEVSGPWTLTFDAESGGPAEPLVADTLFDWSRCPVEAVKHYSGTVVYRSDFHADLPSGGSLFVDLGEVMVMARVRVNGVDVGGVWTAPYRLDITRAVRPGANTLEVEVVNTWVNRLVGDAALPAEERRTWSPCNPWNAASPLQRAGLLGPVVVEEIEYESYKH